MSEFRQLMVDEVEVINTQLRWLRDGNTSPHSADWWLGGKAAIEGSIAALDAMIDYHGNQPLSDSEPVGTERSAMKHTPDLSPSPPPEVELAKERARGACNAEGAEATRAGSTVESRDYNRRQATESLDALIAAVRAESSATALAEWAKKLGWPSVTALDAHYAGMIQVMKERNQLQSALAAQAQEIARLKADLAFYQGAVEARLRETPE